MHRQLLYAQDPQVGEVGEILKGITALATAPHDEFNAAVAYASASGCEALKRALVQTGSDWVASRKRWVISIDFGRTEPKALEILAALAGSDVRVPNGKAVVHSPGFFPPFVFHSKVYIARNTAAKDALPIGLFAGSANLTLSGLVLGNECGSLHRWTGPLSQSRRRMVDVQSGLLWFEHIWAAASPLSEVLPHYKRAWKRALAPPSEDDTTAAKLYKSTAVSVADGAEALRLRNAQALWVEIETLYKNRGPDNAGNQLDLPRGSRIFFGFPPSEVPRNTVFGELTLQCEGFQPVTRTMRFGNNQMDKVNLPIPGTEAGPATYDNSVVLFERRGVERQ